MWNSYAEKDDLELWKLLRGGNLQALETLYRRYYALLVNYGNKCTPDEDLVKDCIQELFIKLVKSTHLSDTESPKAYLLKALRNLLTDKTLSASHQAECFSFNDEIFAEAISDDFADGIFSRSDEEVRLKKSLVKALSQLTTQQKHILYLRYIKELSHKEVAEVMEMNVQSSMNLLSRTLNKLRDLLDSYSISLWALLCYWAKYMD